MNWFINHCFKCNTELKDGMKIARTYEFDAFICEECYDRIMEGKDLDDEEVIMKREWS